MPDDRIRTGELFLLLAICPLSNENWAWHTVVVLPNGKVTFCRWFRKPFLASSNYICAEPV
jgi:hypothetical protein